MATPDRCLQELVIERLEKWIIGRRVAGRIAYLKAAFALAPDPGPGLRKGYAYGTDTEFGEKAGLKLRAAQLNRGWLERDGWLTVIKPGEPGWPPDYGAQGILIAPTWRNHVAELRRIDPQLVLPMHPAFEPRIECAVLAAAPPDTLAKPRTECAVSPLPDGRECGGGLGEVRAHLTSNAQEKEKKDRDALCKKRTVDLPSKSGEAQPPPQLLLRFEALLDETRQDVSRIEIRQEADKVELEQAIAIEARERESKDRSLDERLTKLECERNVRSERRAADINDPRFLAVMVRLKNVGVDLASDACARALARGGTFAWLETLAEQCELHTLEIQSVAGPKRICAWSGNLIYIHLAEKGDVGSMLAAQPCAAYRDALANQKDAERILRQREAADRQISEELAALGLSREAYDALKRRLAPVWDALSQDARREVATAALGELGSSLFSLKPKPADFAKVLLELDRRSTSLFPPEALARFALVASDVPGTGGPLRETR